MSLKLSKLPGSSDGTCVGANMACRAGRRPPANTESVEGIPPDCRAVIAFEISKGTGGAGAMTDIDAIGDANLPPVADAADLNTFVAHHAADVSLGDTCPQACQNLGKCIGNTPMGDGGVNTLLAQTTVESLGAFGLLFPAKQCRGGAKPKRAARFFFNARLSSPKDRSPG